MERTKIGSIIGDQFDPQLFFYIIRKNAIFIGLFFTISLTSAFLYVRYETEIYDASSIIQISSQNSAKNILNVKDIMDSEDGLAGIVELIKSKEFLNNTLSKLPIDINYFTKGTFKANETYTSTPYIVKAKARNPKIYGIPIFIKFYNPFSYALEFNVGGKKIVKKYKSDNWGDFDFFVAKIGVKNFNDIKDQQAKIKEKGFYFTINDPDNIAEPYMSKLEVIVLNSAAKTVQISLQQNNPQKCTDIVNQIADDFKMYDVQKRSESTKKVLSFIDKSLENVYEYLKDYEGQLQSLKKELKTTNLTKYENVFIDKINSLEKQVQAIQLDKLLIDEIEKANLNESNADFNNIFWLADDSKFESPLKPLIDEIQNLIRQRDKLLIESTTNNFAIKFTETKIKEKRELLFKQLAFIKKNIQEKEAIVNAKISETESQMNNIPDVELKFSKINRLFTVNENFYNLLLQKKAEYSISIAGFVSTNEILEKARPSQIPLYPNKNNIFLVAIIIALIASLSLVVVKYFLFNNITSTNEIKKYTNLSILGLVPTYKKQIPVSQLLVDNNPKSSIAEAFRSIRTNMQFITSESKSKVIAITSTVSGEGKTFIAINLAGIIAFAGKKVIILDLDMRKPKIHAGFNAPNLRGMSTLLIKKDIVEDCIQKSNLGNLDFITAGPIPPNPAELIISANMDILLEELKKIYDVIILDN
ncbi:MAG: GumC family protein, partial [Bacteroidota bacterium]